MCLHMVRLTSCATTVFRLTVLPAHSLDHVGLRDHSGQHSQSCIDDASRYGHALIRLQGKRACKIWYNSWRRWQSSLQRGIHDCNEEPQDSTAGGRSGFKKSIAPRKPRCTSYSRQCCLFNPPDSKKICQSSRIDG